MYSMEEIKSVDIQVAEAIEAEIARQNRHIELIASENWVSKAVMAAMGSPLTNKYAEGYPGKRYYGGCACVDVVEDLAIERAKKFDIPYERWIKAIENTVAPKFVEMNKKAFDLGYNN